MCNGRSTLELQCSQNHFHGRVWRVTRACILLLVFAQTAFPSAVIDPEFCSPLRPISPIDPTTIKSAAIRRMAARVHEVAMANKAFESTYRSVETAAMLREVFAQYGDSEQTEKLRLPYAMALLRSGEPEQALKELEKFERIARARAPNISTQAYVMLETVKALCHLRLGEQENCLNDHNAESCILPIRGRGVHQLQRGSRAAVATLTPLLQQFPNDLRARWLLNIAYMTLGEYPAKVPAQWLIDPKVFESDYDIQRFPDVASSVGLDTNDLAGGVVMDDFDNDGLLDVMVSAWHPNSQLRLYRNAGDGTFTDRTAEAGLIGETGSLNIIHADYNNDGFVDVLMLRGGWLDRAGHFPNSLLRNNGDGTFDDVTEEAGLLSFHPTQTAAWFDYDADGHLDLFIGNESSEGNPHPCELFHNNGDGTFTERAAESGVATVGFIKAAISADYNNDGRPDLYLSSRDGPNRLFRNDGASGSNSIGRPMWRFTEVTKEAGVSEPYRSFSCWFFDYDNDGWLDLYVGGYGLQDAGDVAADYIGLPHGGERARLYRNRGDGTFADVTHSAGLYKLLHMMGCNFGDLDNDGWLDFYVGTGDPDFATLLPNRMFRNDGKGGFQDVTTSGGFGQLQKGHGVAFGDIDNDGDQDVYSVVGGAVNADVYRNQLFANPGHGNRWLKLKLEGVRSNRGAHGARIKVVVKTPTGERALYRTVGSGGSFGASPLRQEIGLGDATSIVRTEIFWPTTSLTQIIPDLQPNHFYKIRENDSAAVAVSVRSYRLPEAGESAAAHPMHAHTPARPSPVAVTR
jgi:hypothetical protein